MLMSRIGVNLPNPGSVSLKSGRQTTGLIASYPLAGGTLDAYDALLNHTAIPYENAIVGRASSERGVISTFSGGSYYTTLPNSNSLVKGFSVSVWTKVGVTATSTGIYGANTGGAGSIGFFVASSNRVLITNNSGTNIALTSNNVVPANQLNHILYIKESNNTNSIYVNGVRQSLVTNDSATVLAAALGTAKNLGRSQGIGFVGQLADLALYSIPLNPADAVDMYLRPNGKWQENPQIFAAKRNAATFRAYLYSNQRVI